MILYFGRCLSPSARFETKRFPIPQEMRVRTPGLRSPKSKQNEWKKSAQKSTCSSRVGTHIFGP